MRHAFALIVTAVLGSAAAGTAHAAEVLVGSPEPYRPGAVSIGLGLGDPSALDVKFWTTNYSGFDFGIGLEQFDDILGIYGEYELGLAAFRLGNEGGRGVFYLGVGGAVAFTVDHTTLAVVIPLGFDFRFSPPIDLFVEARPGIGVIHHPAFGIGAQLGVRWRF